MSGELPGPAEQGTLTVDEATAEPVDIYYEVHRFVACETKKPQLDIVPEQGVVLEPKLTTTRMVYIMGFAASSSGWYPLLRQLKRVWAVNGEGGMDVLLIDNRGIGMSSSPRNKEDYTTKIMAQDVLAVMEHLKWEKAHVVGFSMGGMIATKLAAMAPQRVCSLALLGVTAGGSQVLPRRWKAFKYAFKAVMCAKTAEDRVDTDLSFHFTKTTLRRVVPQWGVTVRDVLRTEYLQTATSGRPQPAWAFKGQANAVWTHCVTDDDVRRIKTAKFPVWFIHGRHDLVAAPEFAEQVAARFSAPCVFVHGAHFIPRENAWEVAQLLRLLVMLGISYPLGAGAATPDPLARNTLDAMALNLEVGAGIAPPRAQANGELEASKQGANEAMQPFAVAASALPGPAADVAAHVAGATGR